MNKYSIKQYQYYIRGLKKGSLRHIYIFYVSP